MANDGKYKENSDMYSCPQDDTCDMYNTLQSALSPSVYKVSCRHARPTQPGATTSIQSLCIRADVSIHSVYSALVTTDDSQPPPTKKESTQCAYIQFDVLKNSAILLTFPTVWKPTGKQKAPAAHSVPAPVTMPFDPSPLPS